MHVSILPLVVSACLDVLSQYYNNFDNLFIKIKKNKKIHIFILPICTGRMTS